MDITCIVIVNFFKGDLFTNFLTLINCIHKNTICWITYLNTNVDHLALEFVKQHI